MPTPDAQAQQQQSPQDTPPEYRVVKRNMLWEKTWPLMAIVLLIVVVGLNARYFPLTSPFRSFTVRPRVDTFFLGIGVAWSFVLSELLCLYAVYIICKHLLPRRLCKYRISFRFGKLDCSNPDQLNGLSPAEIFRVAPTSLNREVSFFSLSTPSGPLVINATFDILLTWITGKFSSIDIRNTLRENEFPTCLPARRNYFIALLSGSYGITFLLYLIPGIINVYFYHGSFTTSVLLLVIFAVFAMAVFVGAYLLYSPRYALSLTETSLIVRGLFGTREIPFENIQQIQSSFDGFPVYYQMGNEQGSTTIRQYRFSMSLLPLYFTLCDKTVGLDSEEEPSVAVDTTGAAVE